MTASAIITFSMGVAATLIVIVLVLLSIRIYKRLHQTPKLSAGALAGNTIETQNQTTPGANNQVCVFWDGWLKPSGITGENRKTSDDR